MKNEKIKGYLKLNYYTKGNNNNWYCDFYYYNGETYEQGTTKATGYGYDKQSTAVSNAINKFKDKYTLKKGIKWECETSGRAKTKDGGEIYGIYKDKSISYGIGLNSVINCLNAFNNIKVLVNEEMAKGGIIKLEIIEKRANNEEN